MRHNYGSGLDNILCYEYLNKSFLLHKLRCYTGISGSEKSRNNTREKISYFFTSVDIANQLLTRHRLWRHSVRLINERQSLHDSQYKLFVGAFSNYGD